MSDEPTVTEDVPVITFAGGLPGFPTARRFALVPVGGEPDSGLFRLVCLDEELEFVAAAPPVFFPDYQPEIDDEVVERLALTDAADAVTLVLVTLADPLEHSTANLRAPVVVNIRTREAAQVVLRSAEQPMRRPLVAA